jgi:tetratricopeptide (TPR) repeat protein
MGAARDTFYRIYKHGEQSDSVNNILKQLDFHPLSITLLATVAQHNTWDANRVAREWRIQRTGVLHAQNSGSLAAAIELSLASPMSRELGPDARGLLGVVAFFPQGVNENNIDWLFPTISNAQNVFDKFCILSLAHRTNGFITMLAPLRDYLRPKDPASSPLLCITKECYFSRLSAYVDPDRPGFEESRWITCTSEDVNVEHLLDVFTSIDTNSKNVWDVCAKFMDNLCWHKPRLVMLGPKIEALPDDHPSKPQCLDNLSRLFYSVGNDSECKRLLTHTPQLRRKRGNDFQVAQALSDLSEANRLMDLHKEGIQQAEEAIGIFERIGDRVKQAECLIGLAYVLCDDEQLDAAEEAASRAVDLLPGKDRQFLVCRAHRVLGNTHRSKGDTEKAIHHFEVALEIASSLNLDYELFWVHFVLAELFSGEGRFNDAHAHIERAKSHAINDAYNLGRAMELQANFWYEQRMFERARSEALHAAKFYEKLGAAQHLERCRDLLRKIDQLEPNGEFLETMVLPAHVDFPSQGQETR